MQRDRRIVIGILADSSRAQFDNCQELYKAKSFTREISAPRIFLCLWSMTAMAQHGQPASSAREQNALRPETAPDIRLQLPMAESAPSEKTGVSAQSMRTSSFAMSDDDSERAAHHDTQLESSRIRKTYSRPSRSKWRIDDEVIPETETLDYFDEKDFRNTDR
jgi:hypothetical protein